MTDAENTPKGTDVPGHAGVPGQPSDAELASMSREELLELGGKLDGVEIVYKEDRWPVQGTKAEKRAERSVANWLLLGGLSGVALLLVFLFWPWEYKGGETEGHWWYDLATPLYGLTFGLSILAIGIGAVLYQKKFIPEEISIQDRHDGRSPEIQRKTVAANLTDALEGSTIKRRKLIGLSLGIGLGAFGAGTLVAFIGGLIKNPWKPVVPTADGKKAVLWTSGWTPTFKGETIFVARATGNAGHGAPFVKMRPEDLDAGGMETVFPWRESDGDGTTSRVTPPAQRDPDGRSQPGDAHPHQAGRHQQGGQASGPGELQLRRPVRIHQGVLPLGLPLFALRAADLSHPVPVPPVAVRRAALRKPIFGPAARALAQLPITIDKDGYLVANGDFIEPVGPAFWERKRS